MAVSEPNTAGGVVLDRVAALVHEPVVMEAEQDEVGEARLTTMRPVAKVVCLQVPTALTAGEATRFPVARLEQTTEGARVAPDVPCSPPSFPSPLNPPLIRGGSPPQRRGGVILLQSRHDGRIGLRNTESRRG